MTDLHAPCPWPLPDDRRPVRLPLRGQRLRVLPGVLLAVVLAHGLLLAGLAGLPGERSSPGAAEVPALTIRQLAPAALAEVSPVAEARTGAAPAAVATPAPGPSAPPAVPPVAGVPAMESAALVLHRSGAPGQGTPLVRQDDAAISMPWAAAPSDADPAPDPPPDPMPEPSSGESAAVVLVAATAATAPAAADASSDERPPTYATRRPAAAQLSYQLRRGMVSGDGELHWRPDDAGYELRIEGSVLGIQVLAQTSRGGFDVAGLAPQRFVDSRRGRSARAANFQRDKQLITYSGSSAEFPLLPGAQDRLSWMLQLAAIVEADPARYRVGERVLMQVSGSRGDADVWTLVVARREAVDVVGARIEGSLLLRREPRKPYDTRVEVWLDPARQHLPVRLKLSAAGGNDGLELLLKP